jgi:ribosome-binding factor A
MKYRPLRLANVIRDELGAILVRDFEFSGALVTITEVDIDPKLERAIVKISVIPSEKSEPALTKLSHARNTLQRALLRKVNVKPMPLIEFRIDRGPEQAARIEKILLDQ